MPKRKGTKKGKEHHWSKDPSDKITKPYVPTGKPRGRPPLPEGVKKAKAYNPTGKPRGRPKAK
jgi:hypothetical protein